METWVDPNAEPGLPNEPSTESIEPVNPATVPPVDPVPAEPAVKPVICKKGKCQPYDPAKDRVKTTRVLLDQCFKTLFKCQVLQQQLIQAERERILQQIKSGALPSAEASHLLEELDEDDISPALAKKLRSSAQQKQQSSSTKTASTTSTNGGRR